MRFDKIEEKRVEAERLESRLAALDLSLDAVLGLKAHELTQLQADLDILDVEADSLKRWAVNDLMSAEEEARR